MARHSAPLPPLADVVVKAAVASALEEDLGDAGDLTSAATVPKKARADAELVARKAGRIAGMDVACAVFRFLDPEVEFTEACADGEDAAAGQSLARLTGNARALLSAERVALNFLGHMSGIATETKRVVAAVEGTAARICCTRKTTPGLRAFEKYAVRAGGGVNHRFGLYDGILIKDNHIAMAGGVKSALEAARAFGGHETKIEIEVDTFSQLDDALDEGADAVLLDNMSATDLSKAVKRIDGRALAEASGGITVETAAAVAATGVDLISIGWLTHSAPCLDIALDFKS